MYESTDTHHVVMLVREALCRLAPEVDTATLSTASSLSELDVESVTVVELVAELEERFDLVLPDDELTAIDTVEDLARLLSRHQRHRVAHHVDAN